MFFYINKIVSRDGGTSTDSNALEEQSAMFIYYVYIYLREDNTPYYIGKGKGRRAFSKHDNIDIPEDKSRILLLETNLSEIGAFALERYYIRWYGKNTLLNKTDGGDGTSGFTFSIESRRRMSENRKGKPKSPFTLETRKRMSESRKGTKQSPETLAKLSAIRKGRVLTEEHKMKIKQGHAKRKLLF